MGVVWILVCDRGDEKSIRDGATVVQIPLFYAALASYITLRRIDRAFVSIP